MGTSKNLLLMPDEGIFCGSEERKPSHTLLYGTNVSWRSIGELAGRAQQRACFLSFVTKLFRENPFVWREIGIFRGPLMEERKLKRCRLIFTAIFVFVLIMSCVKRTNAASSSEDGEISGKLTFGIWDSNQAPGMQANIDLFTKANPEASVDLQITPWQEYWQKLRTAASADNLPDLFWMHVIEFDLFASSDALMDLTDRIAADPEISMDNYPQDLVKLNQYKGRQYAVPKDFDTIALWYNKTLFDQAGVAYPDDSWTWEDLVEAGKKLTNKGEGVYGFLANNNSQEGWGNFIHQNGGYIIGPDGRSGFGMPETIEAIQRYVDFSFKDGIAPPIAEADTQLFFSGKVAMRLMGSWMVSAMNGSDYAKQNLDLVVLPKGKKRATLYNGLGYAISANTQNSGTAWAFEKVLASETGQRLQAENGSAMPAFKGTFEPWADSFQSQFNLKAYPDELPYAVPLPQAPGGTEWNALMEEAMGQILAGIIPVESGLKELAKKMNTIIDDNS